MARPKTAELTERELAVMRVFWDQGPATADRVRQHLEDSGTELAYTTVANVVRGLTEKGFLEPLNDQRPFQYRAKRSFEEVSSRLVGHLMQKLFDGSRERLLVHLLGDRRLTSGERDYLRSLVQNEEREE